MLLDEDPATLIHHTISNFNIAPDKAALSRINESLSTLAQSRSLRINSAENSLRQLARKLATLSSQHNDTLSGHSSARHAAEIVELDTKKFRIAKAAQETEVESERLDGELEGLRGRLEQLDLEGVEGGDGERRRREVDDPVVMRLWLYRCLGITLDQDAAGNYNKATIRNTEKGDVHVVNIDPKFSKYFYANYFWQTMQG